MEGRICSIFGGQDRCIQEFAADKFHNTSQPPPSYEKTNKKKSRKLLVNKIHEKKKQRSYVSGLSFVNRSKKLTSDVSH